MSESCLFRGCGQRLPCSQHTSYVGVEGPVTKCRRLEAELAKAKEDIEFEREMKLLVQDRESAISHHHYAVTEEIANERYRLYKEVVRASAELRHAYKMKQDWGLVARAIEILEKAVKGY